ncbi:hypothetical protein H6F96_02360 [Microcoleus sp. FACHB-53]|nr:hypothetical protein [Microcoleus sp. FACHB-53]
MPCPYQDAIADVGLTKETQPTRFAIAISRGDSSKTNWWVGTPCGLSCYSY